MYTQANEPLLVKEGSPILIPELPAWTITADLLQDLADSAHGNDAAYLGEKFRENFLNLREEGSRAQSVQKYRLCLHASPRLIIEALGRPRHLSIGVIRYLIAAEDKEKPLFSREWPNTFFCLGRNKPGQKLVMKMVDVSINGRAYKIISNPVHLSQDPSVSLIRPGRYIYAPF